VRKHQDIDVRIGTMTLYMSTLFPSLTVLHKFNNKKYSGADILLSVTSMVMSPQRSLTAYLESFSVTFELKEKIWKRIRGMWTTISGARHIRKFVLLQEHLAETCNRPRQSNLDTFSFMEVTLKDKHFDASI
jgi:hypothetical protein